MDARVVLIVFAALICPLWAQTQSQLYIACQDYLKDHFSIICGDVTYENAATVIGVAKLLNGSVATYTVEMEFTLNFGELQACFVPLLWTRAPKSDSVPLCGSLVECRNTEECVSIVPQNFNYTLDGVTFQRPLDQRVLSMPYEYLLLTRQKYAASPFPKNSVRAYSINDDDCDNVNLNGCRRVVCNNTDGSTCRYLGYDQKPGLPQKTPCSSSSSGYWTDPFSGESYTNDACTPGYIQYAEGPNAKSQSLSCCSSCNYNNNAQTQISGGLSVFDQSYRQGQAAQWRVAISHPAIANQVPPNFFSPSTPGEVDNSYSCCADATCPDTRNTVKHCNRMSQRFPFPQDPPITVFGYSGLNVNLLPINMSNRLQSNTTNALDRNVTNLRPQYAVVSEQNFNFQASVDYMRKLLNVNYTGVNPVPWQNGVWMPTLGTGPGTNNLITNVICAYCGASNPWNSPTSPLCNTSNAIGGNTTNEETRGGTYAMKNWVIGSSPICHQYTVQNTANYPNIVIPVHVRFGSVLVDMNANMKIGSTATSGGITITGECVNCQNIQDPYTPSSASSTSAENDIVYCEPYSGFAATVLKSRFTNPWIGLKNPTTGADHCENCTPDDFHITQAEMDKYKILWYVVSKESAQHFVSLKAASMNSAGNCNRCGMSDKAYLPDDCDDTSVYVYIDYANTKNSKGYFVDVPPNIPMRCAVNGSAEPAVGMQSYVCRDPQQRFCRPTFTSRSVSMYFQQVHNALAANNSQALQTAKSTAMQKGVYKRWDWDTPNMWLGWNNNQSRGNLFYRYNKQDARNNQVYNTAKMTLTVPSSMVVPIENLTPVQLKQTRLCLCVQAKSTVSGFVVFRVPSPYVFPTQATYSGVLSIDGAGAKCYVNPSGTTTYVSNPFIVQPNTDVQVPVLCTIGSSSPRDNGVLTITLISTAQPQYVGDSQTFYVPCCDSQRLAIAPATTSTIEEQVACPVAFSTSPVVGLGIVNFLNPSCGASAFAPTPAPTPPPATETPPIEIVTTTFIPPVTLTPTITPTRTPPRTLTPTPSPTPTDEAAPEEQSDSLDDGVIAGIIAAVIGVAIILVIVVVLLVYCCKGDPDTKEKLE